MYHRRGLELAKITSACGAPPSTARYVLQIPAKQEPAFRVQHKTAAPSTAPRAPAGSPRDILR